MIYNAPDNQLLFEPPDAEAMYAALTLYADVGPREHQARIAILRRTLGRVLAGEPIESEEIDGSRYRKVSP